jgi:hypothetical protein
MSSEMSVTFYQATWLHILEDSTILNDRDYCILVGIFFEIWKIQFQVSVLICMLNVVKNVIENSYMMLLLYAINCM